MAKQTPKRLNDVAKAKYKELAKDYNLDNALKVELLAQFCEFFSDYLDADKTLSTEGRYLRAGTNGVPYPHPSIADKKQAADNMRRIYKLLADSMTESEVEADDFINELETR
jgi:phage terminase small subunit